MKTTVLDGNTLNPGDLDWTPVIQLGETAIFLQTPPELVVPRSKDSEILIINKIKLNAEVLQQLPKLKCICITATGYDNVDISYCRENGVTVCNAVDYSTDSVAQHTIALLLEMTNQVAKHDKSVREGEWLERKDFSYHLNPLTELKGKVLGLLGFGRIGQKVADLGLAFGMNVIAHHKHPLRDAKEGVEFVTVDKLLTNSDFLSLHVPLIEENRHFIHKESLMKMKKSAILINTARGGLVNEVDLKEALEEGTIAGACLDVLSHEPPKNDNPLFDVPNCFITPHIGWATKESRERLLNITTENLHGFLKGAPQNVLTRLL